MRKTATEQGRAFLEEVPSNTHESLTDYRTRGHRLLSEIKAQMNGPAKFAFGGNDESYLDLMGISREVEERVAGADFKINQIRYEEPKETVAATGYEDEEVDWKGSMERLALLSAQQTYGLSEWQRLYTAEANFLEHIDPQLPEDAGLKGAAKTAYSKMVETTLDMNAESLKTAIEKEFPTEEWIGKKSDEAADASSYQTYDDAPAAEDQGSDSTFQKNIDDEKRHRGITASDDSDLPDFIKEKKEEGKKDKDSDDKDSDEKKDSDKKESRRSTSSRYDEMGYEETQRFESNLEENKKDIPGYLRYLTSLWDRAHADDMTYQDEYTERYANEVLAELQRVEALMEGGTSSEKNAVEDRSGVKRVGDGSGDASHPEDTFIENFDKGVNANNGEPRGPNRRKSDDVPAYSTPKNKLTASAVKRVQANYEVDQALAERIVGDVIQAIRQEQARA